jgi:hypothetical protein
MGNSYICTKIEYLKEIKLNICFQSHCLEEKGDLIIIDLNNKKTEEIDYEKRLDEIRNYFNESQREIMLNYNKKEKPKKQLNKKKHNNDLKRLSDNKYELMLKRLLEQKNEKRKGPKRRETIKNGDTITILVNEILNENPIKIKKKDNQENDLIIKNINNPKNYRFSATVGKNVFLSKNNNKKKFLYRNTINEIINENSAETGFGHLQTKQTNNSSQNKNK